MPDDPADTIEAALRRLRARLAEVRSFEGYNAVYTPEAQTYLLDVVSAKRPELYAEFAPCITAAYLRAVEHLRLTIAREAWA